MHAVRRESPRAWDEEKMYHSNRQATSQALPVGREHVIHATRLASTALAKSYVACKFSQSFGDVPTVFCSFKEDAQNLPFTCEFCRILTGA